MYIAQSDAALIALLLGSAAIMSLYPPQHRSSIVRTCLRGSFFQKRECTYLSFLCRRHQKTLFFPPEADIFLRVHFKADFLKESSFLLGTNGQKRSKHTPQAYFRNPFQTWPFLMPFLRDPPQRKTCVFFFFVLAKIDLFKV